MSGDRVYVAGIPLLTVGPVTGVERSARWTYPSREDGSGISGPSEASFTLNVPGFEAVWLKPGATVEIKRQGHLRWGGVLGDPERNDSGVSCVAYGYGSLGSAFDSYIDETDPLTQTVYTPSTSPNPVIDYAITKGLSTWTRVDSFGTAPVGTDDESVLSIETVVSRVAKAAGKRPHVDSFGRLTLRSDPTAPTLVLGGMSNYLGTTDENFYTRMIGLYTSALDGSGKPVVPPSTVYIEDAAAAAKFGQVRTITVDLTPLGVITETVALANITGRFALVGGRMGWTRGFTVGRNQLTRVTGEPVHPSEIVEGEIIAIPGVRDSRSQVATLAMVQVTVGEVTYNDDDETATVAPLGYVPRDFSSAIAAAQAPPTTEAA